MKLTRWMTQDKKRTLRQTQRMFKADCFFVNKTGVGHKRDERILENNTALRKPNTRGDWRTLHRDCFVGLDFAKENNFCFQLSSFILLRYRHRDAWSLWKHKNAEPSCHTAYFTWIKSVTAAEHWVLGLCLLWKLRRVLSDLNSNTLFPDSQCVSSGGYVLLKVVQPDLCDWLDHFKHLFKLVNIFFGFSRYANSLCNLQFNKTMFACLNGKHPSWSISMFMCSLSE